MGMGQGARGRSRISQILIVELSVLITYQEIVKLEERKIARCL
jgi:hypothetical protein